MSIKPLVRRDLYKEGYEALQFDLAQGLITPAQFETEVKNLPTGEDRFAWYIDPSKQFVTPGYFIPNNSQALPLTPYIVNLAANGTSGWIPIEFDEGSGSPEIFAIVSTQTGDFLITILDGGDRYQWMNRPIHNLTISGNGQRPYYLPLTYPVDTRGGTRSISVQFTDISGAPNAIRFALRGRRFLQKQANADIQELWMRRAEHMDRSRPFFLTPDENLLAVAPGASVDFTLRAPSDAPLDLLKLTAATVPAATPFELSLREFGSGREYSQANLRIHSDHMFGTGQYPGIEFESFFMPKNFRILGTLWNLGVNPTDFYLTWAGGKIMRPDKK